MVKKITRILYALVVLGGLPAKAGPIIDGYFDSSEYTTGYYVNFEVEGGKKQHPIPVSDQGQLWTYQDSDGNLSVAFIQPTSLVDNSYGANAIGWGSAAPSGKNHKFEDLVGSDDARFVFIDKSDNIVLDITMDYLHGYGNKKEDPPYTSGGVVDGEGNVTFGSAQDVLESATSLEYNWVNFGKAAWEADGSLNYFGKNSNSPAADSNYNVTDTTYSDWIFEVIYECKIDGGLFDNNGFGGITIPIVHDSPNKLGKNKVWQNGDLEPVPAPGAVILGAIGLGFTSWLGRRKFSV